MSSYDKQTGAVSEYQDRQMCAVEQLGVEIRSSSAPGTSLHGIIRKPTQEGIDEG